MRRTGIRRRAPIMLAVLLFVLTTLAFVGGSARGQHAVARGVMTPAIGAHPKYVYIGNASPQPSLTVFGCQTRTVGTPPGACYGPGQIRTAYEIQPLLDKGFDGSGRTIVIVDAFGSPTINDDLSLFDSAFDVPAPPKFTIVNMPGLQPFNPNDPNQVGWSAETSLDVQWAHAIAPKAKITLVVAKTSDDADILAATQYAFDHKLGDVLSQSYGEAEQCMDPTLLGKQHQLFERMVANGWTLFASSGDDGSNQPTCDGSGLFQAVSTPASDWKVTAVGGTQLFATPVVLNAAHTRILDPGGKYIRETTWNEPGIGAGGGGFSVVYKRPDFQEGGANKNPMRALPDVSYNAAVDGGVVAFWGVPFGVGAAFRFGGTSAGSPQWAGLAAIADEMANQDLGTINGELYTLAKHEPGKYFHDIADGSNNGAFTATPGFDEATGWGSPIARTLVPALAGR